MQHTLNMYPNMQYNPIKIQDFTILEFYQDNISITSRLGYYILPIQDLTVQEIEEKINNLALQKLPEGYSQFIALPDRGTTHTYNSYDHRICYVVFYQGDVIPSYPQEPALGTPIAPSSSFNPWNEINITNAGGPTALSIILTIAISTTSLEFYINNQNYKINSEVRVGEVVKISKNGVYINNRQISDFDIQSWPYLTSGENTIRIPKNCVSNVQISYEMKY